MPNRLPTDAPDTAEAPDEWEFLEGASQAVQEAIVDLHSRGIATTHLIDGRLVRIHPDGRCEDLGSVPSL